ncbi:MAG: (2Fe-2S) ferredoxin domain-containing protein [Leptolyngbyaceae bacterium]|nr:(2Fe-2S) ferredoxin domain-containing protein [Leptolyngbyaceae bacterium]
MVDSDHNLPMEFNFEGQFLGFVHDDGKLKYMRLGVLSEEIQIKIPKALRIGVGTSLQPGECIQITGIGKFDHDAHKLKLKAAQVTTCPSGCNPTMPVTLPTSLFPAAHETKAKPKIKVRICQKSGCLKKGGKGLDEALEKALCDRNLEPYITIERTGCLKRCSDAPNLVIMPGNHRYTEVRPKMVPQIADAIAQHLTKP